MGTSDVSAKGNASAGALRLLTVLCLAVFVGEAAIMAVLPHVYGGEDAFAGAMLDAAALTVLVFPLLYYFVVRRLSQKNAELLAAETELRAARADLERRVEERTAQLDRSLAGLKQRQREMALLAQMSHLLQGCRSLDETRMIAEEKLPQLFPGVSGKLMLADSSGERMGAFLSWGGRSDACPVSQPECCGAMNCGTQRSDAPDAAPCACKLMKTEQAGWQLCLPLAAQGEPLGALSLEGEAGSEYWLSCENRADDERLTFCEGVAESLAMALANVRLREELQYQALRDPLSGLFNRRYMLTAFEQEFRKAERDRRPLSLAIFDIDHFKRFNDTYGHDGGDALIAALGRFLQEEIGDHGIVARYGGEEFVVLMADTPLEVAALRIESLRMALAGLDVLHNGEPLGRVTLSAGVSAYPYHGTDPDLVLKAADSAMYRSKRDGRNRVSLAHLTERHIASVADETQPAVSDPEPAWMAAAG